MQCKNLVAAFLPLLILIGYIFEALQILRSGYRNGHIRVSEQAEVHFTLYLKELADLELDDDMPLNSSANNIFLQIIYILC